MAKVQLLSYVISNIHNYLDAGRNSLNNGNVISGVAWDIQPNEESDST